MCVNGRFFGLRYSRIPCCGLVIRVAQVHKQLCVDDFFRVVVVDVYRALAFKSAQRCV